MKSLSYLNKYFVRYKWRLLLGLLFLIGTNYFQVKMPDVVGQATDTLRKPGDADKIISATLWLALLYVMLSIAKGIFLFFQRQTIIVASRLIEFDLKNEIYQKYQELDYTFYKSQTTGDLMNRISEDVSQVRQYLGPGIMYTINLAVLFPMVAYQMLSISPKLTLYALAPLPIMAVLIYLVSSRMSKLGKEVQKEQSMLSTIAQETFSGMRVIKAYLQEQHTRRRFHNSAEEYKKRNMKLVLVNALFIPTISFLIGAATLLSIYVGGLLSMKTGPGAISEGDIVRVILFINMLTWPFASVGWVTSIIQRAAASQARINEFLKAPVKISNPTTQDLAPLENIKFENTTYTYPGSIVPVINNVSFELERGKTLGIVGRTGSGKSTLVQLLMRQLDPQKGKITYNGEDMRNINLAQFRRKTGVVPQDVFLFSETIGENIAFGLTDRSVTKDEIRLAAKDAHVLHNIESFEHGFDTILGERGVNLSGGQKQRVSIARALIRGPQLLVLDDCLSAVDTETEEVILKNLRKFTDSHQTATVIVSHRISSLRNAEKILVIDNGEIVQSGSHEELVQNEGIYQQMYVKQLAEADEN